MLQHQNKTFIGCDTTFTLFDRWVGAQTFQTNMLPPSLLLALVYCAEDGDSSATLVHIYVITSLDYREILKNLTSYHVVKVVAVTECRSYAA